MKSKNSSKNGARSFKTNEKEKKRAQAQRSMKRNDNVDPQNPMRIHPRTGDVPGKRTSLDDVGMG